MALTEFEKNIAFKISQTTNDPAGFRALTDEEAKTKILDYVNARKSYLDTIAAPITTELAELQTYLNSLA